MVTLRLLDNLKAYLCILLFAPLLICGGGLCEGKNFIVSKFPLMESVS